MFSHLYIVAMEVAGQESRSGIGLRLMRQDAVGIRSKDMAARGEVSDIIIEPAK